MNNLLIALLILLLIALVVTLICFLVPALIGTIDCRDSKKLDERAAELNAKLRKKEKREFDGLPLNRGVISINLELMMQKMNEDKVLNIKSGESICDAIKRLEAEEESKNE